MQVRHNRVSNHVTNAMLHRVFMHHVPNLPFPPLQHLKMACTKRVGSGSLMSLMASCLSELTSCTRYVLPSAPAEHVQGRTDGGRTRWVRASCLQPFKLKSLLMHCDQSGWRLRPTPSMPSNSCVSLPHCKFWSNQQRMLWCTVALALPLPARRAYIACPL